MKSVQMRNLKNCIRIAILPAIVLVSCATPRPPAPVAQAPVETRTPQELEAISKAVRIYYKKISNQVDPIWKAKVKSQVDNLHEIRNARPTHDVITSVVAKIDVRGNLRNVQISSSSGSVILDRAALEAFDAVGTFPIPPKELVEANHLAVIRWDFLLKK